MTVSLHTPLKVQIISGGSYADKIHLVGPAGRVIGRIHSVSEADSIARACNAHERQREALEMARIHIAATAPDAVMLQVIDAAIKLAHVEV